MTAFEFLKELNAEFPCVPMYMNGNKPIEASNGQIRRWLDMGAVQINGGQPKAHDNIEFPVWELIFFPHSKNRVSIHYSEEDK